MLVAQYPPTHLKHLALDPLCLSVLPIESAALGQIFRRVKPLFALLRLLSHPRPPRLPKPRPHRPREALLACMALPPHLGASVRLLRHRLLDQAVEVRQAGVGSARAAGLDRRRVGVEADDAAFGFHGRGHSAERLRTMRANETG